MKYCAQKSLSFFPPQVVPILTHWQLWNLLLERQKSFDARCNQIKEIDPSEYCETKVTIMISFFYLWTHLSHRSQTRKKERIEWENKRKNEWKNKWKKECMNERTNRRKIEKERTKDMTQTNAREWKAASQGVNTGGRPRIAPAWPIFFSDKGTYSCRIFVSVNCG